MIWVTSASGATIILTGSSNLISGINSTGIQRTGAGSLRFRISSGGDISRRGIMDLSKYQCVICRQSGLHAESNLWRCDGCGHQYSSVNGIPRLYVESRLGQQDKK